MSEDFLPYSRQQIEEEDIEAVVEALHSAIISQGSSLERFEQAFASRVESKYAVGVSSGTAALHAMCSAAGLQPGDEVVLPALTFASTANAVLYTGAKPVFVDVEPDTFCIDPSDAREAITPNTKAVLAVDMAGYPAPYGALRDLCSEHELLLLADSAHSVGGSYEGRPIGSIADMTAFSFNPVKNMTAAEGGMVTGKNAAHVNHLRAFRSYGMTRDPNQLEEHPPGGWYYEQQNLGFNYKLSELHAALGLVQLARLDEYNAKRRELAGLYRSRLADLPVELPYDSGQNVHTWHLFVVRVARRIRTGLFAYLREHGLGVQVHYIPVPMHPHYRRLGYTMDRLRVVAEYYDRAISLPLHPGMESDDVDRVAEAVRAYLISV